MNVGDNVASRTPARPSFVNTTIVVLSKPTVVLSKLRVLINLTGWLGQWI